MSAQLMLLLALLAASSAIGLSLYAALALPGLLAYLQLLDLPPALAGLATPLVWLTALGLLAVEIVACRFRFTDLTWNTIHTVARPLAAFLFASAALADAPTALQWWGAAGAALIAFLVHTSVLAVRTARRTAGPAPAGAGFTAVQLAAAALLSTFAWTAPPFAAAIAVILLAAPFPWAPRLWGSASMAISALVYSIGRPDRRHRWKTGTGRIPRRLRPVVRQEFGDDFDTVRSAPVTLARLGPAWPYLRGRILIASRHTPLFTHRRGLRPAIVHLVPAEGHFDHGALVETLELEARTPYTLCLGPDAPAGPVVLAALNAAGERSRNG